MNTSKNVTPTIWQVSFPGRLYLQMVSREISFVKETQKTVAKQAKMSDESHKTHKKKTTIRAPTGSSSTKLYDGKKFNVKI